MLEQFLKQIAQSHGIMPDHLDDELYGNLPQKIASCQTLEEAFEINPEQMESFYRDAYTYYEKGYYEQALFCFRYLALFNTLEKKYWMGLAACQQLLADYEKALKGYAIAHLLDSQDPYPHFYAYECYKALNDTPQSLIALKAAFEACQDEPFYQRLKKHIQQLLITP